MTLHNFTQLYTMCCSPKNRAARRLHPPGIKPGEGVKFARVTLRSSVPVPNGLCRSNRGA